MAKFRKKPIVIEAVQVPTMDADEHLDVYNFFIRHGAVPPQQSSDGSYAIVTLEGTMVADQGDWIIRGVKGEFYPCKPDIFAATYDPEAA
jgi:hypothetical protein